MKNNWYEFKATAADSAEVFIYDEIGGWGITAGQFIADLKTHTGKALTVRIHSPGGSVLDGHAIFNALLRHKGGVTIQIDGIAASMASVIAMSGKPVRMAENAFVMIHNPTGGVWGGSEDMRKSAELLDKMRDGLVNIYAQKTGKDTAEIEEAMDAETWFTADEAKAYGLVDEITDRLEIAANFDLTRFAKLPAALKVDTRAKDMADTIDSLKADLATALSNHTSAAEQAKKNFADYKAAIAEREAIQAKLDSATVLIGEQKAKVTELESQLAARVEAVNTEAARVLAATGHPAPVETDGTTQGASQAAEIYAAFKAANSIEARKMLNDATTGPIIRAESARLHP